MQCSHALNCRTSAMWQLYSAQFMYNATLNINQTPVVFICMRFDEKINSDYFYFFLFFIPANGKKPRKKKEKLSIHYLSLCTKSYTHMHTYGSNIFISSSMHFSSSQFYALPYNCNMLMREHSTLAMALDDFCESLIRCMILVDIDTLRHLDRLLMWFN